MTRVCNFITFGQSNDLGVDAGSPPAGIPAASILFNLWTGGGIDYTEFGALDRMPSNGFGPELAAGLYIQDLGVYDVVAVTKVAKGATTIGDWKPGDPEALYDALLRKIQETVTWARVAYPGAAVHHILHTCLGESDAANPTPPTNWAENYGIIQSALEGELMQTLFPIITLTNINQASNASLAVVRAEQADAAYALVNMDDVALDTDDLHYTAPGQIIHGERVGVAAKQVIFMTINHSSTVRDVVANAVVDSIDAGAGAGNIAIRDGTTILAELTLDDPSFDDSASGYAALLGVPIATTGVADGTADNFLARDSDDNIKFFGSVTVTGGGGDLTLDSVAITIGADVTITGGGYTAPP